MINSRPVHAPIGDCDGASGVRESLRHALVVGLYAAPSENASPQQPPPQPISSLPVQTTMPLPAIGARGRRRHWLVTGLKPLFGQTSISLPVQNAGLRLRYSVGLGGGGSRRQVRDVGLYAARTLDASRKLPSGATPVTPYRSISVPVQTLVTLASSATGAGGRLRHVPASGEAAGVAVPRT